MNWLKLERLLGPNSQLSDNIFHMKLDNQMVDTYRVNNVQFETKNDATIQLYQSMFIRI